MLAFRFTLFPSCTEITGALLPDFCLINGTCELIRCPSLLPFDDDVQARSLWPEIFRSSAKERKNSRRNPVISSSNRQATAFNPKGHRLDLDSRSPVTEYKMKVDFIFCSIEKLSLAKSRLPVFYD